MTVDELYGVLEKRLDLLQSGVDRINGRVSKHDDAIVDLRTKGAYVAGAVVALGVIWESIRRKLGL